MRSALYIGSVMHRRLVPKRHSFRYSVYWLLIDLDELEELTACLSFFSHNRFNLFSLYDRDHGDGSAENLREQIAKRLERHGLILGAGKVRLLCMPRTMGHCFNPLSVYFCEDAAGAPLALIYEVHNTFGERHSYVLAAQPRNAKQHQSCAKAFYVSPFLDTDMQYRFSVTGPDRRLSVGIEARKEGRTVLSACLAAERHRLDDLALLKRFFLLPAVTLKVVGAIHWEALRLWLKGVRLQPRRVRSAIVAADAVKAQA